MNTYYTDEKNILILIALLKKHNISKIVVSPGTTNLTLVASLQQDDYFEMYSSADERSAAYMACGIAEESGEPVALSCTGATASRNYIPALTEAYYRQLPVLAITSCQHMGRPGHHFAQVIDRTAQLNDMVKMSVQIPSIYNQEDEWSCVTKINDALLELRHHGGGPVHINISTTYSKNFSTKELPDIRRIDRITYNGTIPKVPNGRIAVFIGSHLPFSDRLTQLVDEFCVKFNAVVLCDWNSNYYGKYRVFPGIVCYQDQCTTPLAEIDLMIHIGNVSGSSWYLNPKEVWRVNPDGVLRDTFRKLSIIFEMYEEDFFSEIIKLDGVNSTSYYDAWSSEQEKLEKQILDDLPFSNTWIAQHTIPKLPNSIVLHLGILNSFRTWSFFDRPELDVQAFSNTGGFGIDGCVSSLIGSSLVNKDKLHFGIFGDLAFFYDLNSIANRHIQPNIRIILVNNGRGTEFTNYNHPGYRFGKDADLYIAAGGHYGKQSKELIKHFSTDLGFTYLSATNKKEFLENLDYFVSNEVYLKPVIFEVFTDSEDESNAIKYIHNLAIPKQSTAKKIVRSIVGEKTISSLKKIIK